MVSHHLCFAAATWQVPQLSDVQLFVPERQPVVIKGQFIMGGAPPGHFKWIGEMWHKLISGDSCTCKERCPFRRATFLSRSTYLTVTEQIFTTQFSLKGLNPGEFKLVLYLLNGCRSSKMSLCRRTCRGVSVSLCDCSEPDLNEHVCSWGGWSHKTHAVNTDGNWKRAMKEANLLFISGCTPWGKAPSHSNAL